MPLETRKQTYFDLSSKLAYLSEAQLLAHLEDLDSSLGWGKTQVVSLDDTKVFVKRLSVTKRQYKDIFDSRNLYDLPMYYNYGVGSAGFGAPRELLSHIKTSNWVLSGACTAFPLLYHHRVISRKEKQTDPDPKELGDYVTYWGSNEQLKTYVLDRVQAPYELMLFLEYLPYELETWLPENLAQAETVVGQLIAGIDFLHANSIIHFDANPSNLLTDGEQVFFTDFGLLLNKQFHLDETEKAFFDRNSYYDYGEVLGNFALPLKEQVAALGGDDKRQMLELMGLTDEEKPSHHQLMTAVNDHLEVIQESGIVASNDVYFECLKKYSKISKLMTKFFGELRRNNQKDTVFPNDELKQLLMEAAVIP